MMVAVRKLIFLDRDDFRSVHSLTFEVGRALFGDVGAEQSADGGADLIARASGSLSQQVFELGKDLLDRVQVRRVFRQ